MTWPRGQDKVQALVRDGSLEYVSGAAADGAALLASAGSLLESASRELTENPEAAYVLAYDAARKSCVALLAQQGLRTKTGGHHVTTEQVVRAQFGGPFDAFSALRRRRSEIEYPRHPGEDVSREETAEAVAHVTAIHHAAGQLLPNLPLIRPTQN